MLNGSGSGLYYTHTGSLLLSLPKILAAQAEQDAPAWLQRADLCFNYTMIDSLVDAKAYEWTLPLVWVRALVYLCLCRYVGECVFKMCVAVFVIVCLWLRSRR